MSCISHKNKSLFIHVPKAAGTSMNKILKKADWSELPEDCAGHETIKDYYCYTKKDLHNRLYGIDLDSYFKWAFVRNPWDRIVSAYLDSTKDMETYMEFRPFIEMMYTRADDISAISSMRWSATEYVTFLPNVPGLIHYMPELPCLTLDGECKADFIGRFENLDEDWKHIGSRYPSLDKPLPHSRYNKLRQPYQYYYDYGTQGMVGEIYKRDIDYFDYKF